MLVGFVCELVYIGEWLLVEWVLVCGFVNVVLFDVEVLLVYVLGVVVQIVVKLLLVIVGSKLVLNYVCDYGMVVLLQQMSLLQSVIFDIVEMGVVIVVWKVKVELVFVLLGEVGKI